MLVCIAFACTSTKKTVKNNPEAIWTFTYVKATENQRTNLKIFLQKNWFVMDSIAVIQKLIDRYTLYENDDTATKQWDYIVAVKYFTRAGYDGIAQKFEAIREKHITVKVDGKEFRDLGKVIKSEQFYEQTTIYHCPTGK